jgi:phosphoribosylaminoimidazole-succinocarboxamide synthase
MDHQPEQIIPVAMAFRGIDLALAGKSSGKVRDWYPMPGNRRLFITTDRLSAFDRVLGAVPFKGQVLNQLSAWWFANTTDIIPNHVIDLPDPNALVARAAVPIQIEVIVRGYITGVPQLLYGIAIPLASGRYTDTIFRKDLERTRR